MRNSRSEFIRAVGVIGLSIAAIALLPTGVAAQQNGGFIAPQRAESARHSNQSVLKPYGVWAVIAPFNFPMALAGGPTGAALVTGNTQGKEYAELPWILDIVIAVLWVTFAINFFGTIAIRREQHLYVAIWFYIATIVAVAILHIGNSMVLPYSWLGSYSAYAGVKDALMQWWYGHNAVAFFLTTPFLGLMYYYLPKAAERPVYSLSLIHI